MGPPVLRPPPSAPRRPCGMISAPLLAPRIPPRERTILRLYLSSETCPTIPDSMWRCGRQRRRYAADDGLEGEAVERHAEGEAVDGEEARVGGVAAVDREDEVSPTTSASVCSTPGTPSLHTRRELTGRPHLVRLERHPDARHHRPGHERGADTATRATRIRGRGTQDGGTHRSRAGALNRLEHRWCPDLAAMTNGATQAPSMCDGGHRPSRGTRCHRSPVARRRCPSPAPPVEAKSADAKPADDAKPAKMPPVTA